MNVHVSYKVHKTPDIEKEISRQIEKIERRLHVFRPELVHLKAVIDQNPAREGTLVSLNLRLPSGQLTAQEKASSTTAAIKAAFDEIIQQIGRHKELLRASHKWRRWRGGPQADEEIPDDGFTTSEVVNEVIARALGDHDRPEKLSLEPWLYRLALQAMNEMTARLHELESPEHLHLEDSRRQQNVQASDEAALQFHQPDEGWTRESAIPDRRVSTPEQSAYSDEVIALVQAALRGADRADREAFLLYGIEGFSLSEIAGITGRHVEAVRESVQRARDCVRNAPSLAGEFPQILLAKTRT